MKIGTLLRVTDINKVDEIFSEFKANGFNNCQLVYKPQEYTTDAAKLIRNAADKYGIDMSAMFCGFRDPYTVWDNYYGYVTSGINIETYRGERTEYLKSAFKFAKETGISDVIIHAGFVSNNPFSSEYQHMCSSLGVVAVFAKNIGINILLETGNASPITLLRLIEDVGTGNLYINLDPANILMYGYGNPVDAIYVLGKYIRNMHGKDGMLPTDTRNLGKETPVGDGMVDFPGIIKKFKEIGYDRYITIEREITGEQQKKDILKAKDYLSKLLKENDITYEE